MATYHITLPDDLVAALPLDEATLTRLAQEALLVRLYALGEIGSGKLAQLLGISRREALDLIGEYGVSTFDDSMDLDEELRILSSLPSPQVGGVTEGNKGAPMLHAPFSIVHSPEGMV